MRNAFLVTICIFSCGVAAFRDAREPRIDFTRVPYPERGGSGALDMIEGRAVGAKPSQAIVLYARSGDWYIQPFVEQPLTEIQPDSTWGNPTHLGTEYAALLVDQGFTPPTVTGSLPQLGNGVAAIAISEGAPYFWQTSWFKLLAALVFLSILFGLYRVRMNQLAIQADIRFEERLAERMRIAQELHDTLLQGFLSASFQLHVAADQLPDDLPAKAQIVHVQELIGKVIAEGRDAVRDLRSSGTTPFDPGEEFLSVRKALDVDERVDFRVIIDGKPEPIRPLIWADSYNITRESLTYAFRHAQAKKIEVEIEYARKEFRIFVRDDGCGIEPDILESGRDGHWGLSGMRERSEKIGANLKLRSRVGAGTEVELSIPNRVAFESARPGSFFKGERSHKRRTEDNNGE